MPQPTSRIRRPSQGEISSSTQRVKARALDRCCSHNSWTAVSVVTGHSLASADPTLIFDALRMLTAGDVDETTIGQAAREIGRLLRQPCKVADGSGGPTTGAPRR